METEEYGDDFDESINYEKQSRKSNVLSKKDTTSPIHKKIESKQDDYYRQLIREIEESEDTTPTLYDLEQENARLRYRLKELNIKLSKLVEHKRPNFGISKNEISNKPLEEKIELINRQMETGEKTLALLEEEHEKTKTQLVQGKDVDYIYSVEKEIENVQKQIEATRKENKKLSNETLEHGKALQKIETIQEGDDKSKAIEVKMKEVVLWRKRIIKLKEQMGEFKVEKKSKQEKLDKVSEEHDKLLDEVKDYDIGPEDAEKAEKRRQMTRRLEKETNDLKLRENTYKFNQTQTEKSLEQLLLVNLRDKEHLHKLESMVLDQLESIKELSEKAGMNSNSENLKSYYLSGSNIRPKYPLSSLSELYPNEVTSIPSSTKNITYSIQNKTRQGICTGLPIYKPTSTKAGGAGKNMVNLKRLVHRNESMDMGEKSAVLYRHNDRNQNRSIADTRKGNASVMEYSKKRLNDLSVGPSHEKSKGYEEIVSKPNIFRKNVQKKEEQAEDHGDIGLYQPTTNTEELASDRKPINGHGHDHDSTGKEEEYDEERRRGNSNSPMKSQHNIENPRFGRMLSLPQEEKNRELKLPEKHEIRREENYNYLDKQIDTHQRETLVLPQTNPASTKNIANIKDKDSALKFKGVPLSLAGAGNNLTLPDVVQQSTTNKTTNTDLRFNNENVNSINSKEESKDLPGLNGMNRMNRVRKGGSNNTNVFDVKREENDFRRNQHDDNNDDIIQSELPDKSFIAQTNTNKENERKSRLKGWQDEDDTTGAIDFGRKEEKRPRAHLFEEKEDEDDIFGSNKGKKLSDVSKNVNNNYEWIAQGSNSSKKTDKIDDENEAIGGFVDKRQQRLRMGDSKPKGLKEKDLAQKAEQGDNGFFEELEM